MDQSYSAVYPSGQYPCQNCQQSSGFTALPQITQIFPNIVKPGAEQSPAVPGSSPQQLSQPITDLNQPMPMTAESLQYLNGFLRTQIGRKVRVEFLLGTNTVTDRIGTLVAVGANYILINEYETDDLLACDFYNIKFIRFYY